MSLSVGMTHACHRLHTKLPNVCAGWPAPCDELPELGTQIFAMRYQSLSKCCAAGGGALGHLHTCDPLPLHIAVVSVVCKHMGATAAWTRGCAALGTRMDRHAGRALVRAHLATPDMCLTTD
eukprot:289255-Chlamydomonas_euryale.AAC.5